MNEFQRKLADLCGTADYISLFADPGRRIANIDNYAYTIDGQTLSANITQTASQTFNVPMDTDSDFVLCYMSGCARLSGGSDMIWNPAINIQILDKSSARNFFNQPTLLPFVAGAGGFPFLLGYPRVIRARSTLALTAISAQNQAFSGFFFTFHGGRIYYA